ncbi:MAG: acyl-CoA thioesterase [Chitinophagales bacterium]
METQEFSAIARLEIPFNDCDPLNIVWHGNYIRYFELAREEFGKKYDFDVLKFFEYGYATPIVHASANYKRPLRYRDVAIIKAMYRRTDAAKIIFDYEITKEGSNELICHGNTVQVMVAAKTMELVLTVPPFITQWMQKIGMH